MKHYGAQIIATYGSKREVQNEEFLFASREVAKAFAEEHLDDNDDCARYTIYDIDVFVE